MIVSLRQQIINASYVARCQGDPGGMRNLDEVIADALIAKVPAIASLVAQEGGLDRKDIGDLNEVVGEIVS